ncbi:hypothetical protein ACUIJN_25895 [Metabacillus halosaccharovorans]|uniref:hypothetical protein n=1 Tax=Metabacillus TaxID=2675233 RepID=UPI000C7FC1D5|nr:MULTISPECIES: hypothetical protein [Metabacillus]MCM3443372.1 hypothetical protein [Metabacillus halosaccharovorans]PMC34935.1 hypothetical protein CJ195_20715 [Bacillus sp. UMB0899]
MSGYVIRGKDGTGGADGELLLQFPFASTDTSAFLNSRKSNKQRQVFLKNGVRIKAPEEMSTIDIIRQNLKFLMNLESFYEQQQIDLFDCMDIA